MMSHQRVFLSLRQQLLSTHHFNRSVIRSSSVFLHRPNPKPSSFPYSTSSFRHEHLHVEARCQLFCISLPLTSGWSFQSVFNGVRSYGSRMSESNNRPPKETIMLAGCDWKHWLVVVESPDPKLTRDDIIDGYIKTLAHIVGSEEEARMKMYSVSTRHYYAFGALLSEELAYKLKDQVHVRWVLPDSYLDVKNKTYAGKPFINGQAVPYDPKYHEIWVRNHEASLKSNNKNKKQQRDPNSTRSRSRSPSLASSSSGSNLKWVTSDVPQNEALQISDLQSQKPGHSSLSVPSFPEQNEIFSGSQTNQMTPAFSQSQASQYSRVQNQSSRWNPARHEPSADIHPNCLNWANKHNNWTSAVGSENEVGHGSQVQNPAPQGFNQSQAPQYTQMKDWSSSSTLPPPEPSATLDPNCQNYQQQAGSPSQLQNHAPPQLLTTMDPTNRSWTPVSGSMNQPEQPSQRISQMLAHEYSGMKNHLSPTTRPLHKPSPTMKVNSQSWSDPYRNDTAAIVSGSQIRHPSHMQSHSSPETAPPSYWPSATTYPNHWSSSEQCWNPTGYDNQANHSPRWQDYTHMASSNHSSAWNSTSQSWESSQSLKFSVSPQNLSYDNLPPPPTPTPTPTQSHLKSPDIHRGGIQSQVQQTGYLYRDTSHGAQTRGSQNGYPPHEYYNPQDQGSDSVAYPQGWNNRNYVPNTSIRPQGQTPQFQTADMSRSMQNTNFHYKMGKGDDQAGNFYGGEIRSCVNIENTQTIEYQERDIPSND